MVQPENLREYLLQRGGLLPADGLSITEENVDRVIEAFRQGGKGCEDADHLAMFICSNCSLLGAGAAFQAAACARAGEPVYRYLVTYDFPHPGLPGEALFLAHGGSAAAAARGAPFGGRRILPGAGGNAGFLCARRRAHHEGKALAPVYPGRPETMVLDEALPVAREPQEALLQALGTTL